MGNRPSASNDAENYLRHYPDDHEDDLKANLNYRFYKNEIKSHPDGDFIDNIHKDWIGNHDLLERHHGYIQWLFPIREESPFNSSSQKLMKHEIDKMTKDATVRPRLIASYCLMLEFYGMRLIDENTGEIGRGPNWQARYTFLNTSMHNFLRITRILKCLGELGLDHYQAPFVANIFAEIQQGNLTGLLKSARDYFAAVVRDEQARTRLQQLASSLSPAPSSFNSPTTRPLPARDPFAERKQAAEEARKKQQLEKNSDNNNNNPLDNPSSSSSPSAVIAPPSAGDHASSSAAASPPLPASPTAASLAAVTGKEEDGGATTTTSESLAQELSRELEGEKVDLD